MKTKKLKPEEVIKEVVSELFKLVGIEIETTITVVEDGAVMVKLQTDQEGLLIGYHGENLNAIQLLVSLIVYRRLGEWTKVVVEIGDYRQKREESLTRLAQSVAEKVKTTGQMEVLPPMPAFERRIIHMALAPDTEVETYSEGEVDRHVVIKLREQ